QELPRQTQKEKMPQHIKRWHRVGTIVQGPVRMRRNIYAPRGDATPYWRKQWRGVDPCLLNQNLQSLITVK
ncbi:hypothetical protein HAX54_002329, partial [Datura stramonium]|nr:hypothetical protein [Datura stramonium]